MIQRWGREYFKLNGFKGGNLIEKIGSWVSMKWIIAYEIGSVVLTHQKSLVRVEMNILSVVYILFYLLILVIIVIFVLFLLEIEREILEETV